MSPDFAITAVAIMDCGTRHRLFWITYGPGQLLRIDAQLDDIPHYLAAVEPRPRALDRPRPSVMARTILWSEETPREPGSGPECGFSCRGIWRELRDEIGHPGRRGWGWECDKRGCPHGTARANPQREEGRDASS